MQSTLHTEKNRSLAIRFLQLVSDSNGYETELKAFGECFSTNDMKEGTSAFLEKRKPHFKGE